MPVVNASRVHQSFETPNHSGILPLDVIGGCGTDLKAAHASNQIITRLIAEKASARTLTSPIGLSFELRLVPRECPYRSGFVGLLDRLFSPCLISPLAKRLLGMLPEVPRDARWVRGWCFPFTSTDNGRSRAAEPAFGSNADGR